MDTKYENLKIDNKTVIEELTKITNQIYKLLPDREEGVDWSAPLSTIIEELVGMNQILVNNNTTLFAIICKLEGLYQYNQDEDFFMFRRTIFECLNLLGGVIKRCQL